VGFTVPLNISGTVLLAVASLVVTNNKHNQKQWSMTTVCKSYLVLHNNQPINGIWSDLITCRLFSPLNLQMNVSQCGQNFHHTSEWINKSIYSLVTSCVLFADIDIRPPGLKITLPFKSSTAIFTPNMKLLQPVLELEAHTGQTDIWQ